MTRKTKTNEELLARLKKANKTYRLQLAKRAGFTSYETYKAFLVAEISIAEEDKHKEEITVERAQKEVESFPKLNPIETLEKFNNADDGSKSVFAFFRGTTVDELREQLEKEAKEYSSKSKPLDMVIAFDVTSSMSSYIEDVKAKVVDFVNDLFSNTEDLMVQIIAFGDYCDMQSHNIFGNAYQRSSLTDNKAELVDFINSVKYTYGGDAEEFYELVINKVVEETPWRSDSQKALFLIGDNKPHPFGYEYSNYSPGWSSNHKSFTNHINWKSEVMKAKNVGIQIDTLSINPKYSDFYKEVSETTNGIHIPYSKSNNVSEILKGATYVRTNKEAYKTTLDAVSSLGDEELTGAFKTISKKLD